MIDSEGFRRIGPWQAPGEYRGALVLPVLTDGRLLLQMRDDIEGIIAPGKWGLFGGQVEAGEVARAAAAREFHEETGLEYPPDQFEPAYKVLSGAPRWGLLHVFVLRISDPVEAIRAYEGSGFACCSCAQCEKLDVISYLRPVLRDFWGQTQN